MQVGARGVRHLTWAITELGGAGGGVGCFSGAPSASCGDGADSGTVEALLCLRPLVCVCVSVSFKSIYHIDQYENMGFRHLELRFWGC
jgi:hypothetical protein